MIKSSTIRRLTLILIDICCFAAIFAASFVISEYFSSTSVTIQNPGISYWIIGGIFGGILFLSRLLLSVYTNVWRYANSKAYLTMVFSDVVGGVVALVVTYALDKYSLRTKCTDG